MEKARQANAISTYPENSFAEAGLNVATHSDFFVNETDMGWRFKGLCKNNRS